jgi:hypothetical protein
MAMSDTSPAARELYYRLLAEKTPSERVQLGVALVEAARITKLAALRHQFPNATEDEIRFRLCVARYGEDVARKYFGPR